MQLLSGEIEAADAGVATGEGTDDPLPVGPTHAVCGVEAWSVTTLVMPDDSIACGASAPRVPNPEETVGSASALPGGSGAPVARWPPPLDDGAQESSSLHRVFSFSGSAAPPPPRRPSQENTCCSLRTDGMALQKDGLVGVDAVPPVGDSRTSARMLVGGGSWSASSAVNRLQRSRRSRRLPSRQGGFNHTLL